MTEGPFLLEEDEAELTRTGLPLSEPALYRETASAGTVAPPRELGVADTRAPDDPPDAPGGFVFKIPFKTPSAPFVSFALLGATSLLFCTPEF